MSFDLDFTHKIQPREKVAYYSLEKLEQKPNFKLNKLDNPALYPNTAQSNWAANYGI